MSDELKEKGEDNLIKVNSDIGSINSNLRELERISSLNKEEGVKLQQQRDKIAISRKNIEIEKKEQENFNFQYLEELQSKIQGLTSTHKLSRKRLSEAAGESGEFSKQNIRLNNELAKIKKLIEPFEINRRNLEEEIIENNIQRDETSLQIKGLVDEKSNITEFNKTNEETSNITNKKLTIIRSEIDAMKTDIDLLSKTKLRLTNEQLRLEKDLSRFESRKEALNESRGSFALRILLEAGLEGIHGYVAQLGEVNENNRYALEIAAGGRLGQIVVDNDNVASKAIAILKKKNAGRLTFLPLNRIKSHKKNFALARFEAIKENGYVDKAINLINYDEVYSDVFKYVFGDTLVFSDLESAKLSNQKVRLVTLGGELLEVSGAITGGSKLNKDLAYRFGSSNDTDDSNPIKDRLLIIEEALRKSDHDLSKKNQSLNQLNANQRRIIEDYASSNKEIEVNQNSLNALIQRIEDNNLRLKKLNEDNNQLTNKLDLVNNKLKPLYKQLGELEGALKKNIENNRSSSIKTFNEDFDNIDKELDSLIQERDMLLNKKNQLVLNQERIKNDLNLINLQEKNLHNSVQELSKVHQEWIRKRDDYKNELLQLENQKKLLEQDLGILRRKRDQLNSTISNKRQEENQFSLKLEYLERDINALNEEMRNESIKLDNYKKELPDPLPNLGKYEDYNLDSIQSEVLNINVKLESLEPVNMLALDELEELSKRLNALVERLEILSNERSELLLRIETVSTMRQEAFMEAFVQVDKHFKEIFATLSDGDGYLQLENPDSPLDGGLTLVAHPKGKNVRRLASMSGGEKSLTALSFLFALQKYKPSPFYALDEVDSFLDGINVERLSNLISNQSSNAQFIVVSHRRPMIGASQRTIGVAQARGANTQVVGLPNAA